MKQILSVTAAAFAFTVCVSAQATPPSQAPSQPNPKPPAADTQKRPKGHDSMKAPATVTLTGCLRQGDTPDTFQLENPQMTSPAAPPSASAESGSTATKPSSSAGMPTGDLGAVTLLASADIDLKPHVGHRVEVRGTMAGMPLKGQGTAKDKGDTMGSAAGASSSSATGTSGPGKAASHTLKVRGLNHLSDTCSE